MESSVAYNPKTQSCYCPDCMETVEIRRKTTENPEALLRELELIDLDHAECSSYKDVKMARNARRFRKAAKRIQLLEAKRNPMGSAGCFRS